ncbi:L-erythro-3,5-diaminohexanoate dehydrogenase, partial [Actinomadura sp. BRA 177]|uniref:L-erythro-3,5-diaminohexanoate dehydrogenase n=1 Tax=Actinomadura sp. BRA 177 TaxID=2745202 RepID=UPI0015956ADD
MTDGTGTAAGLHRVLEPAGVLPQAAHRLDTDPRVRPDEVRIAVERLNLDAASYRQLHTAHGGDPDAIRAEVLRIIGERGKMHNPVTGSGGMLVGVVEGAGPESPLGLKPGDRVATLVSLTLTPLAISDGLAGWDGLSEQVPARGHAILFARSIAAVLPADMPVPLALAVMDVCGAPALTARVVAAKDAPTVAVLGAAGKSGCLSLAAARRAGASRVVGLVPTAQEAERLAASGLADAVARPDARDPAAVPAATGAPPHVTVGCVAAAGREHGATLPP